MVVLVLGTNLPALWTMMSREPKALMTFLYAVSCSCIWHISRGSTENIVESAF